MPDYLTPFERRAATVLYRYLRGVVRPGNWLLPANVCPIVPAVFSKAGRKYEFGDIAPDTLCLDPGATLARVRRDPQKFAGVLFVRTYGHAGDFEEFFDRIKSADAGLQVIDDRCLCRPCFRRSGGVAELELYSSGYSKFVDLGWGGWGHLGPDVPYHSDPLPFDPAAHDQLMQAFRASLGERTPFVCPPTPWLDARTPEVTFPHFRDEIESRLAAAHTHRECLNAIYSQQLESWALPGELRDWRFSIRCSRPQELLRAIFAAGHFASAHYASLAPMFGEGVAPVAERLGRCVVNLFNDFRYTPARATELVQLVAENLRGESAVP